MTRLAVILALALTPSVVAVALVWLRGIRKGWEMKA